MTRRGALVLGTGAALSPLLGCRPAARSTPADTTVADAEFAKIAADWMDATTRAQPSFATTLGDHRFDAELDDVSAAGRAARGTLVARIGARLLALDRSKLSRDNQVDAAMLSEGLEGETFSLTTLEDWRWDPLVYSGIGSGALYTLVARDFAPLQQRLIAATARMEKLPDFLAQVRQVLEPARVPAIHAATYSKQNGGAISIVDELIMPDAPKLGPADRKRLGDAADRARAAVREHQTWIDKQLLPNAKGDHRLGAAKYDTRLRLSINDATPRATLRQMAEAIAGMILAGEKGATRPPATSSDAERHAAIAAAFAVAARRRPLRDKLFEDARRALDQATAYVRDHDLITLPDAPVKVIEMPKFQQGVAVAYCDPPGALDRKLDTLYVISPIPKEWSDAQTRSFLSEYNSNMLYELGVHEAMPGHYVQLWHANRYPGVLRAVLASGPFVEGWACYAEDMMIEQGFGADDPLRRLTNLKMRLRSTTNAILDQGVHVDGWDEKQAMDFMVKQAFQEEREASGKWTRARVSSGQLSSYFVGAAGHKALRRQVAAKQGSAFKLKSYHDSVLSHGSPPLRFVRQLLFDEAIA